MGDHKIQKTTRSEKDEDAVRTLSGTCGAAIGEP